MSVLDILDQPVVDLGSTTLSLENIKNRFNDKVAIEIEQEFSRFKRESGSLSTKMLNDSRVIGLIKSNLGIKFKFVLMDGDNAGVPYGDFSITANAPLSPYSNYAFSKNGNKILAGKERVSISVDRVSGYISGIDKIEHTIYMGREIVGSGKLTAREAMAVFLHELGHIWTYYLTLPHIYVTNFIISEYAERFIGVQTEEARTELIKEASDTFRMEIIEKERLMASTKKEEVAVIMFSSQINKLKSIMGKNPYDVRNSEAIADQFVVRFGYGKDLATGLGKDGAYALTKNWSYGKAIHYAVDAICFAVAPPIYAFALLVCMFVPSIVEDKEYDDPVKRIEVLLHGLRDRLKESHTREDKRIIMGEIDTLESFLKENSDYHGVVTVMYNHVIPWGRSKHSTVNFQKAMEALKNNSLNTRAEKLRDLL